MTDSLPDLGLPTRSTDSVDRSYVRTNERTNGEPHSPTANTSSSVTHARTYEFSISQQPTTAQLLDRLIDAIARATSDKPQRLGPPPAVERDPAWKLHRAQARAACIDRDVCAMPGCLRATGLPLEEWCHRHAPDDVAIERYIAGEPMTLMRHERLEAIRRMHASGQGWHQIQGRLRVSGETMRAALGEREAAA